MSKKQSRYALRRALMQSNVAKMTQKDGKTLRKHKLLRLMRYKRQIRVILHRWNSDLLAYSNELQNYIDTKTK